MDYITDWAQIIMVCPCFLEMNEISVPSFQMEQTFHNITFNCKNSECKNTFDYDIKVRLVELLNAFHKEHGTLEGFYKYVERKKERIRLRYIQNANNTNQTPFVIIEVANITRCPQYKLTESKQH